MPYWDQQDLEARISPETVRQIFDDDYNGNVDGSAIARLQADSDSYVDGFLRGIYTLPLTVVPNEVKRLSLDVAVAYAVDRWPDYVRVDGEKLRERARGDLMDLRNGKTRLDVVGTPEPGANEGGTVLSGDPDDPTPRDKFFIDGTGDF